MKILSVKYINDKNINRKDVYNAIVALKKLQMRDGVVNEGVSRLRSLLRTEQIVPEYIIEYKNEKNKKQQYHCRSKDEVLGFARVERDIRRNRKNTIRNKTYSYKGYSAAAKMHKNVHATNGFFIFLKKAKDINECFVEKKPSTPDKHVGIELEFCSKVPAIEIAKKMTEQNLQKVVTLKKDGSLRSKKGDYVCEVTVVCKQTEYKDIVKRVTQVLNDKEVGAYVNETCGMHVHLDFRQGGVEAAYTKLFRSQKFLIDTQPVSRRRSPYCRANMKPAFIDSRAYEQGRYFVINTEAHSKFHTLEIRSHSGTTDASKINYWIEMLIGIVSGDVPMYKIETLKSLQKYSKVSDECIAHMKSRLDKFKEIPSDNENTDMSLVTRNDGMFVSSTTMSTINEYEELIDCIDPANTAEIDAQFGPTTLVA